MRRLCAGIILVAALAATGTASPATKQALGKQLAITVTLVKGNTFTLTANYSGSTPSGRFFVFFNANDDKLKTLEPVSLKGPFYKRTKFNINTMLAFKGVGPHGKAVITVTYAPKSGKMCLGVYGGWIVKSPQASYTLAGKPVCNYT